MKLALHRSITFWSGILVMVFIVWTWRQSTGMIYNWTWRSWSVSNLDSCIAIGKTDTGSAVFQTAIFLPASPKDRQPFNLGSPLFIRFKSSPPGESLSWAKNAEIHGDPGDLSSFRYAVLMMAYVFTGGSVLLIPHGLLLLAVFLPWSGLLILRAWRRTASAATVGSI